VWEVWGVVTCIGYVCASVRLRVCSCDRVYDGLDDPEVTITTTTTTTGTPGARQKEANDGSLNRTGTVSLHNTFQCSTAAGAGLRLIREVPLELPPFNNRDRDRDVPRTECALRPSRAAQ
jgi:hypothetical protein